MAIAIAKSTSTLLGVDSSHNNTTIQIGIQLVVASLATGFLYNHAMDSLSFLRTLLAEFDSC